MTYTDGPPDSFYEPPDDDLPCPDCGHPLLVSADDAECTACGYVDEPDYEAIAEAKAERRDSGDMV